MPFPSPAGDLGRRASKSAKIAPGRQKTPENLATIVRLDLREEIEKKMI
jgi:hypothetical protein